MRSAGSHGGDYEDCNLLGCDAVYAGIMYNVSEDNAVFVIYANDHIR